MGSAIGTLLLLGASGDLAGRLLLPALGQLLDAEQERRGIVLVGAGSEDWDAAAWQERVRSAFAGAEERAGFGETPRAEDAGARGGGDHSPDGGGSPDSSAE